MAQNTLGTGVLVLKANSSQLDEGLDKSAKKIKDAEKKANASASGFKVGMVLGMGSKVLEGHARRMQEEAKRIQGIMAEINDSAGKAEAQRLGIIPGDDEIARIERGAKAWDGWGKRLDQILDASPINVWLDQAGSAIDDMMGIKKVDPKIEKEFLERQRKAKAEQESLTKSVQDFDAELTKNAATIGKTAGEIKLYDLALKGVDVSKFQARLLAGDIKAFEAELKKSIGTIGMTAEQVKLWELKQRGAKDAVLATAKALNEQKTRLDELNEAMTSLVVKNPEEELGKKTTILKELFDRGRISMDEYARSLANVSEQYQQMVQKTEPKLSAPNLKAGTAETMEFLINSQASMRASDPAAMFREAMKDVQNADKEKIGVGLQIVAALKDKPLVRVEKVDLR